MTALPSGKTQQTYIIQAIGMLAGAPNVSVRSATAKTKTFELLGIDPEEFVGTTIGNETKARNPCDLAFNRNAEKLKKQGFIQSGGRGKYALTPEGFKRFQVLSPEQSFEPMPTTTPVTAQATPAPVASKPAAQSVHKVAVMAGGIQLATPTVLREDAHLLNMQKSNSPCFGIGFTNNSKVCARCPIAGMCQRKRMGGLAQLATLVKQGVADGNLGVVLGLVAPPVVEEKFEQPLPEPVEEANLPHTIEALPVEIDGVECDHCKTPIAKGSKGYIVAHVGLVHEHCVNSALKGGA